MTMTTGVPTPCNVPATGDVVLAVVEEPVSRAVTGVGSGARRARMVSMAAAELGVVAAAGSGGRGAVAEAAAAGANVPEGAGVGDDGISVGARWLVMGPALARILACEVTSKSPCSVMGAGAGLGEGGRTGGAAVSVVGVAAIIGVPGADNVCAGVLVSAGGRVMMVILGAGFGAGGVGACTTGEDTVAFVLVSLTSAGVSGCGGEGRGGRSIFVPAMVTDWSMIHPSRAIKVVTKGRLAEDRCLRWRLYSALMVLSKGVPFKAASPSEMMNTVTLLTA